MDTFFRVVEVVLGSVVVAGQGVIGGIAVAYYSAVFSFRLVRELRFQFDCCLYWCLALEPYGNYVVRGRCKIIGPEGLAVAVIRYRGYGVRDVQLALVVRDFSFWEGYFQRAKRLVGFAVMALEISLELIGPSVVFVVEGLPYGLYVLCFLVADGVRLSGPEGYVVDG